MATVLEPAASRTLASPSCSSAFWPQGWHPWLVRQTGRSDRGRLAADVLAAIPEGFDQRRNDLGRLALRHGAPQRAPSPCLPDFRSAINSSVDLPLPQPPHASKPSHRTQPVCTRITQVLRLNRGEKQGEWPCPPTGLPSGRWPDFQGNRGPVASPRLSRSCHRSFRRRRSSLKYWYVRPLMVCLRKRTEPSPNRNCNRSYACSNTHRGPRAGCRYRACA